MIVISDNGKQDRKNVIRFVLFILVLGFLACEFTSCNSRAKKHPSDTDNQEAYVLVSPSYPDMPAHPEIQMKNDKGQYNQDKVDAYIAAISELQTQPEGYKNGYDEYCANILPVVFSGEEGKNCVFSPLGLFMVLGMTTEITDENSRQQILNILHQPDLLTTRSRAKSIWQANYMDDGLSKLVISNSLWTNTELSYNQSMLDILAGDYYAYSFGGNPSSKEYNQMLQKWISSETDGLLDGYFEFDPDMYLTLASIVEYSGKWKSAFEKESTSRGAFHSVSGDVSCEFMQADDTYENYYGDHFSCVALPLVGNGQMRLILPEEGSSPEDLLKDVELISFLVSEKWEKQGDYKGIHLTVPKFDVSSQLMLKDCLTKMGMTDAFDSAKANFGPLTEKVEDVSISSIIQDTRVLIDEEGCIAASLTIETVGAGFVNVDYSFTLDRPFMFEIVSETGLPIFVGIVNDPS